MGHYASEMMCNKCGQVRCVCPRGPDPELTKWLVDEDLTVMLVSTFDAKYKWYQTKWGPMPGNPYMRRMSKKLFDTREEALTHRRVVIDEQIERAECKLANDKLDLQILKNRKAKVLG